MKLVKIILVMLLPIWLFAQSDPEDIYPYPAPSPSATNITAAEYFFDEDPGFGNGTSISVTSPGLDLTFSSISINISGLSAGIHNVFIRTQNAEGEWSQASYRTFVIEPDYPIAPPVADNITDAEYFFDVDPGVGNGVPISITNGLDVSISNETLNLSGLSEGVHTVFLRTKDATGIWSQTSNRNILIEPTYSSAPPAPPTIVKAEYFTSGSGLGGDPGFDQATAITLPSGQTDITLTNESLSISGLVNGINYLYLRTQNADGEWSQTSIKEFSIINDYAYPTAPTAPTNIDAAEYFFDDDPGFGLGTSIAVTPGQDLSLDNVSLDISGLGNGIHFAFLRTRNVAGEWSQTSIAEFEIVQDFGYPSSPPAPTNIVDAEYFFDSDPGFGLGTSIPITDALDVSLSNLSLDVSSLGEGIHFVFLRTQSADGEWSQTSSKEFEIVLDYAYPTAPPVPTNIIAAEYFFDTDPGLGNGTDITALTSGLDVSLTNIPFDISGLDPGTHNVFLRSQNNGGEWSQTSNREFTIQEATDCTSTSTWNGTTWSNGVPDASTKAIIEGDFTLTADAEWCRMDILSGSFTINQDVTLTLSDTFDALVLDTAGNLNVEGIISSAGNIENNGNLVFKSTVNATGQLDVFPAASTFTGDIQVERYMSAKRAFRFVSTPVGGSQTIRESWQENASTGNFNPNPGFGTHITGEQGTVGNVNPTSGLDETSSGNASMFRFNNSTGIYDPVNNTNIILDAGIPYALFIRGDRGINLTDNLAEGSTTLRAAGSLLTGTKSTATDLPALSTQLEGFSLIPNPYQAIVNFNALTFSGGVNENFLYVFDPSAATFGAFVTLENPTDASEMFIRPGQSFFVVNLDAGVTSPVIEFEEADKATNGAPTTTVFNNNPLAIANLELFNTTNERLDVLKLRFESNAFNGVDSFDALKLLNQGENVGSVVNNKIYAIQRRGIPQQNEVVPMYTANFQNTQYEFRLVTENWDSAIDVFIQDNYLNTTTPIDISQPYGFTVDANIPESIASDRFSLVFDNTTLGVDDNAFGTNFNVYPNPTKDGLFTITTPGISGDVNLEISNILGQTVMAQSLEVNGNQVDVDAKRLASGVYLVELSQNNQSFTTKVIVE